MKRKNIVLVITFVLLQSCIIIPCLSSQVLAAPFIDNNGMVIDQRTWLVWQKQDDGVKRTWGESLSYCEDLDLAGYNDWRLPNIIELESITDDSRYNPAIDPVFTKTRPDLYWSSTTHEYWHNLAWFVHFSVGGVDLGKAKNVASYSGGYNSYAFYARCVRGGQFGPLSKLTVTKLGDGTGSVTSSPPGISCGPSALQCSPAYFSSSPLVILEATPQVDSSVFSGWTGNDDCSDGSVAVTADKTCTAKFDLCSGQPVRIDNTDYSSITYAYNGASSSGSVIRVTASNLQETIDFNSDKDITLSGGYDCALVNRIYYTTITGSLAISSGRATAEHISIK